MLLVAMAQSSSDGIAKCYVLLFLWMMSCFLRNEANGLKSRMTLCFVKFARWRHYGDIANIMFGQVCQMAALG